jgi:hypothetical protein
VREMARDQDGRETWRWRTMDGRPGSWEGPVDGAFEQQVSNVARALRKAIGRIPEEQRGLLVAAIVDRALNEVGYFPRYARRMVMDHTNPRDAGITVTPSDEAIGRGWAPPPEIPPGPAGGELGGPAGGF